MKNKLGEFADAIINQRNITRWDKFPSQGDDVAGHSFRTAMLCLLCAHIEHLKFGSEIDLVKTVSGGLFHDLNETLTENINHATKKNPRVQKRIYEHERQANELLVSWLPGELQPFFEKAICQAEDDSLEGEIVIAMDSFDAMLFCHREVVFGNTYYFPEKFEEIAEKMRHHHLPSVRYMMEEFDDRGTFYQFLISLINFDMVKRWRGRFNTIPDNDAIHTYEGAAFGVLLCVFENEVHGKNHDILRFMGKFLCHDLPEEIGGDVNGLLKHSDLETEEDFRVYEQELAIELVERLPEFLRANFYDYCVHAKDESPEGKYVAICDKIDALIKANLEVLQGQRKYKHTYTKILEGIQENYIQEPGVQFFLSNILHHLTTDL